MILVVGGAAVVVGYLWVLHEETVNAVTFVILLVLIPLFYCLTVEADNEYVSVKFGIGLIKTKFERADIESCKPVRNKWYYGWGVRRLDRGWMYNISGLDAVEIHMKNGKVYRIGTDEPEELCKSIQDQ